MYNLIVSSDGQAWETDGPLRFPQDRFMERSTARQAQAISLRDPQSLALLETVPTLLVYERHSNGPLDETVRIGRVRDVRIDGRDLLFRFEEQGRINREQLMAHARVLDLQDWEHTRTRWALKEGTLPDEILASSSAVVGFVDSEKMEEPGRSISLEVRRLLKRDRWSASVRGLWLDLEERLKAAAEEGAEPQVDVVCMGLVLALRADHTKDKVLRGLLSSLTHLGRERLEKELAERLKRRPNPRFPKPPTATVVDGAVQRLLKEAVTLANETASDRVVAMRHLFAAGIHRVISLPAEHPDRLALDRLGFLPQDELLSRFAAYFKGSETIKNLDRGPAWERFLVQLSGDPTVGVVMEFADDDPRVSLSEHAGDRAEYACEFRSVGSGYRAEDALGVEKYAHRLADLIARRATRMPLAIGLFGNWGSGKSHFMALLDQQLARRGEEGRKAGPASDWCGEIVPIYFNAWHYVDANLWASLVSHIFERIFAHLAGKRNELEELETLLEHAAGATTRAGEELALATRASAAAHEALAAAEKKAIENRTFFEGARAQLAKLLPEKSVEQVQQQVVALLGAGREVRTVQDLGAAVAEARGFSSRLAVVWRTLFREAGWRGRLGSVLVLAVVTPAVLWFVAKVAPEVTERFGTFGQGVTLTLAPLLPLVQGAVRGLRRFGRGIETLETWTREAAEAQRALATPELQRVQAEASTAEAAVQAARAALEQAQAREQELRAEMAGLSPGRRLGRFIERRAQSDDYRGQQGLVSLARRDFDEMSAIFADQEALDARVKKLRDDGHAKDADRLVALGRTVDRIVLFIDDLDRCEPENVVQVLQAVHLLLAFPLFAVVVGVDQRCLRRSLRKQFPGLIGEAAGAEDGERGATPLDYLEKIFHVPFRLPAMEEAGFKDLVRHLTKPLPPATARKPVPDAGPETVPPKSDPPEKPGAGGEGGTDSGTLRITPPAQPPPAPAAPGATPLALHEWERQALAQYHGLVGTPRAVTRLLNTYWLVRAGVPAEEWETFQGDAERAGEFRVALLLLAAAAGHPARAERWFTTLERENLTALAAAAAPEGTDDEAVAWRVFHAHLAGVHRDLGAVFTPAVVAKWSRRVRRYTF